MTTPIADISRAIGLILLGAGVASAATDAVAPPVNDAGGLEEIVVTAEKVTSTVQSTPIAIQAFSGNELEERGVSSIQDAARLVPGLSAQPTGGAESYFIRGVGSFNESSATDNGLAISLDQMYFSRPYGPDMALYDLQRVEVLKGPQGTLYGRNATGGGINFISNKPVIGEFGGSGNIEVGNYSTLKLDGALNLPVSPTVAVRIAAQTVNHSGYLSDGYNDAHIDAGRLHVLWDPANGTSLLLTAEYMYNGSRGDAAVPYANNSFFSNNPWLGPSSNAIRAQEAAATAAAYPPPATHITPGTFATASYVPDPHNCAPACTSSPFLIPSQPGPLLVEDNGFTHIAVKSLRADFETNLNFATLSVIPTYLVTDANLLYYTGGSAGYSPSHDDQGTFELRLTSPRNQPLTWIGGAFIEREVQHYDFFNASEFPNLVSYNTNPDVQTTSRSVFAQADYAIVDNLKLTAGIRYTNEVKKSLNSTVGSLTYFPIPPSFVYTPELANTSAAETYRIGLEWQATRDNLLYANWSTGFHAGGFNGGGPVVRPVCQPNPNSPPPVLLGQFTGCDVNPVFKPEYLRAFAIGSKNRFLDNKLQVNAEIYDWHYTDLQQASVGPINPGVTTLRIDNAGASRISGFETEVSWLATSDDLLSLNFNYNHSVYGTYNTYFVIEHVVAVASPSTGKQFLYSPNEVFTFGYLHTFRLADGSQILPGFDGKFSSKTIYSYETAPTPDYEQPAFVKYNASVAYRPSNQKWSASLFVRNLTNKATVTRVSSSNPNEVGQTLSPWAYVDAPRTYGINAHVDF